MGRKKKELIEKQDNILTIRKEYFRKNEKLNLSKYTNVYVHLKNGLLGVLYILKGQNAFYFLYAEDEIMKSNEIYIYSRKLQEVLDYVNNIGLAGELSLQLYNPKKATVVKKSSKLA